MRTPRAHSLRGAFSFRPRPKSESSHKIQGMTDLKLLHRDRAEPSTLRTEVEELVAKHKAEVEETVRDWVLYHVKLGARTLPIEECPVPAADRDYVTEWLRAEGFTVRQPKLWGRLMVDLVETQADDV